MRIHICTSGQPIACHFCSTMDGYPVASIVEAPAILGCTAHPPGKDQFVSFYLYVCKKCGLIQTDAKVELRAYAALHSEAIGKTWEAHHDAFTTFINENYSPLSRDSTVLEIGASAQPIARRLSIHPKKIYYIDPIEQVPFVLADNETYLSGFFPQVAPHEPVDLVILSHVLEHVPQTAQFLQAIYRQLHPHGKCFVSIPLFETWLRSGYFNAFSAEHIIYPFDIQMQWLAQQTLSRVQMQCYAGHSLFAIFIPQHTASSRSFHRVNTQDQIFLVQEWVDRFNRAIVLPSLTKQMSSVFIAGASHLSQYLVLSHPYLAKTLSGVLDNSSRKWGQRLYGTSAITFAFTKLRDYSQPIVILPPSPYRQEMQKQIEEINSHTQVIAI